MNSKGYFIVVDGLDGSGKTTTIQKLKERFKTDYPQCQVEVVQGIGSGKIGKVCRERLFDKDKEINGLLEIGLFMASLTELYCDVILPALERGSIVIADRYISSFFAYQYRYSGIDTGILDDETIDDQYAAIVESFCWLFENDLSRNPNIWIHCECDVDIAFERMALSDRPKNFLDNDKEKQIWIKRDNCFKTFFGFQENVVTLNTSSKEIFEEEFEDFFKMLKNES